MRVLIIGVNVGHIARSASRAGHEVFAVDCYCDVDLSRWTKETGKIPREGMEERIPFFVEKFRPDAVVLGPGLETASVRGAPVLNNAPEKTAQVSDKFWMARWLEEKGFPFIKTRLSAEGLRFPCLVKPRKGAGGVGCRVVNSPSELKWEEGLIAQELVLGLPASVSVIGDGRTARAIAVNEQLIGVRWAGAKGFRYSGNITPHAPPQCAMGRMAEEIAAALGLVGSNGVDFILTEKGPVVVEVNTRFQGSLDAVEPAAGINVFQAHIRSFSGELPERPVPPFRTAGRIILFAPRELTIEADLVRDWTTDVPGKGVKIAADDPILSILAQGSSRDEVMARLKARAATLGGIIKAKWQE